MLTSTELSFQNQNHDKVASFGAQGAYADRLRSNQTLSVGTESNGWYEFTTTKYGMAEKWRDGTSSYEPLYIVEQPQDCYVDFASGNHSITGSSSWNEQISFTARISTHDGVTAKSQFRRCGDEASWTNSNVSGDNPAAAKVNDDNTVTRSGSYGANTTGTYEFRFAITRSRDNVTIYTEPRR